MSVLEVLLDIQTVLFVYFELNVSSDVGMGVTVPAAVCVCLASACR